MSKIVAGKKPLSSKPKQSSFMNEPDFFFNKLSLPEVLKQEITAKDLDYRFIDYKKYVAEGNTHSRGWKVYKPEQASMDAMGFLTGTNPDGIIRRGSTVLAVRPLSTSQRHRDYIQSKNEKYKRFKQSKAEELRQVARDNSVDTVVDDEYDEDNE